MNATEIEAAVRLAAFIPTSDDDWTSAVIRQLVTAQLRQVFARQIVNTRLGYWLHKYEVTTTAGRARYRIPYRAVTGMAEAVQLQDEDGSRYEIEADNIVFCDANGEEDVPTAGRTLRLRYYLTPSLLVQEQTAGRVTAVDVAGSTVTVNSLPVNRNTAATIASGDLIDIVHSNGWHELAVVGVASTISVLTLAFPAGTDVSDVVAGAAGVGSMVRAAEQSDWPQLHDDFHQLLAEVTAVPILHARKDHQKAEKLAYRLGLVDAEKNPNNDLARFRDLLQPRVKNSPLILKPRYGVLRRSGRRVRSAVEL